MCLLFESIKVINGEMLCVDYHNQRINRARHQLLDQTEPWDLRTMIKMPELSGNQVYKCKIVYANEIISIDFQPYTIKPLQTLKLVECPDLTYNHKYLDRSRLELLKSSNSQTDDIIIVKHEFLTDCSFANIVFFDNEKWITPSTPLLKGTKRQKYINNQTVVEDEIKISDLKFFSKARIINAMINLEESRDILPENIFK
jgi:4-amino-4-deoxychorismate lyase